MFPSVGTGLSNMGSVICQSSQSCMFTRLFLDLPNGALGWGLYPFVKNIRKPLPSSELVRKTQRCQRGKT